MQDYKAWVPSGYLAQYYATGAVTEDERSILRFITSFLKEKKLHVAEMLEVGCGPTVHHAIPFVPYVDHLYMADYLESNLQEIQKWLDRQGHDWQPYIAGTLELEGIDAPSAYEERVQDLRAKIAGLLQCNALNEQPLGLVQKTFPLVTSFYCLECIARSKDQWEQTMSNVLGLVAPGGWTILSALRQSEKYLVCGKEFPATSIDELDMRQSLVENGFIPGSIDIQVCGSTWGAEGFDAIIVCCAQKGIGA